MFIIRRSLIPILSRLGVVCLTAASPLLLAPGQAAAQTEQEFLRALRPPPANSAGAPPLRFAPRLEDFTGPAPTPAPPGFTPPAPAPRPAPPAVCAQISTPQIRFRFGSAELDEQWISNVRNLAAALNNAEMRGTRVRVTGHTDGVGSDEFNLELSRRRADSVREFLIARGGVDAARILTDGLGKRQLAKPQDPTHGENRRVEIATLC